jgi:hypothetical protein
LQLGVLRSLASLMGRRRTASVLDAMQVDSDSDDEDDDEQDDEDNDEDDEDD